MAEGMQGKVALITGAASGIGLATTEALIAAGARVVLADRDEKALGALRGRLGEAAVPLVVDLLAVPIVVVTAIGLGRVLPDAWRRAVESAALVNLLLVLVALPFLSGLGRRADNPSLLDRNYLLGFGVLVGLVWLVALVPPTVRALRRRTTLPEEAREASERPPTAP